MFRKFGEALTTGKLFDNTLPTWTLIALIVISVIGGNAYLATKTISELSRTQHELYNTSEAALALNDLHISILSAETGQRGYLLTEVEEYLTPYKRALRKVSEQMDVVSNLKYQHENYLVKIRQLLTLSQSKLDELETTVELALENRETRALSRVMTGRGKDLYQELLQILNEVKTVEFTYRDSLFDELKALQKEATVTFLISGITSALLLFGMLVIARLNLNNEDKLKKSLEQQNENLATQVKIRTQELTVYSDELSRSNRELEDFAFVASHDLQEPLRKIRAFGDRLKSNYAEQLEGKGADYINRMQVAAERMSNLINDLLEFSRVSTKGKDFVEVDLNQLMTEILGDLEIAIEESQGQISIATLPQFQGDKGQMYQLFLNLFSNAIKFRKPDVPPQIQLTYQNEQAADPLTGLDISWHVLTLTDNGIGFEQEFADKIFVPFQRLHGRKEFKGTGIGLAVCRRIVERHGGTIEAKSELNHGAQFVIKIPVDAILFNNDGISNVRT
ncbi:CHASE3 domain-containing protein [Paraglaciecola aquimarina]|uniref:histidine kinase n=1 Tax=Paraglaciecola aquimarina TaxID=1235557 RepID=A0ABU3SSK5_9ALTE|nr:ATP-binding protein [Paraglaciecola aquimarina]MDU0352999.1 CHASE3 domain-containing protein [Paraglaciecola aquimarina]